MVTRVSPPGLNQDYGENVAPPPQVSSGGGGGTGTVTSITATAPIVVTPSPSTTAGDVAISTMVASGASHARGATPDTPAVAGTTLYLREDATWAAPPGGTNGSLWMFGDGSDGAVHLDGTNTFSYLFKSGNEYCMTGANSRDIFPTTLTIDAGITLHPANYRIFCSVALVNNGSISERGATGAAGPNSRTEGHNSIGILGIGSAGGVPTVAAGNPATTVSFACGGVGGNGGNVGATLGGSGISPFTVNTAPNGGIRHIRSYIGSFIGHAISSNNILNGGGGGGGGAGDGVNSAGGAGSGGDVMVIFACTISGNGTIDVDGGAGQNASSVGSHNLAGGGGGGGGCVTVWSTTPFASMTNTITAAGGIAGNGNGTGTAGTAGTAGQVTYNYVLP